MIFVVADIESITFQIFFSKKSYKTRFHNASMAKVKKLLQDILNIL